MELGVKSILNKLAHESDAARFLTGDEKRRLQSELFSMLTDIDRVFAENGIEYSLSSGTTLGAVRHGGFIPWDDDIDILMTRDQWEKLKKIAPDIAPGYFVYGPRIKGIDSHEVWGKIYRRGSQLVEVHNASMPYPNEFSIDIFILDRMANNAIVRKIDLMLANILRIAASSQLYYKYPNPVMKKLMKDDRRVRTYFIARRTLGFLTSILPHRVWINLHDRVVGRHKNNKPKDDVRDRVRYFKRLYDANVILPYSRATFEGKEFNVPGDVHEYLRLTYGDTYMQLPPEDKRELHIISDIQFPDSPTTK